VLQFFFAYLNYNNKSGTESRFILRYLNFHKSLIPTQSSLWFLTLRPRCDPFVPCWNFINKSETEPRFILPYLNFYNSLISTRSCLWFLKVKQRCDLFFPYFINESETEMWFLFLPYLNSNNESGTESRFILPYLNFYKSLIPYRIMCMVL
jgi:hypothetical protein